MKVTTPPREDELRALRDRFDGGVPPSNCPSRTLLTHVTGKWAVLVLVALAGRTPALERAAPGGAGVSEKMLAQTLQTLQGDELVHREAFPVVPPHVEYRLTELGEDLVDHLVPLVAWTVEHAGSPPPSAP